MQAVADRKHIHIGSAIYIFVVIAVLEQACANGRHVCRRLTKNAHKASTKRHNRPTQTYEICEGPTRQPFYGPTTRFTGLGNVYGKRRLCALGGGFCRPANIPQARITFRRPVKHVIGT